MEEFQEADILWPDTAAAASQEGAPSGMCYGLAASCCSVSSGATSLLIGRCSDGFLSGSPSTAVASNDDDVDEGEELMEADVLWPDTAQPDEQQPRGGVRVYRGWSRGELGSAGRRRPKSGATARLEGHWRPAASSPIDIPAVKVATCCR
uniref:Uncharacterized protein n=1 Tax=Oryza brachyantha TaxID=4533 RepID=J3L414_ORYBR